MTAQAAQPDDAGAAGTGPSVLRRMAIAALLVAQLLLVPIVVGLLIAGSRGAFGLAIGSMAAFLVASAAGWKGALRLLPIIVAVVALAAWTAHTAWWVVLLSLLGAAVGLAARIGWAAPLAFTGIIAAIAQPASTLRDILLLAGFATAGYGYGLWVSRRVGLPARQDGIQVPLPRALVFGIMLAVVTGVAATIALAWGVGHAYWLPMTVFILAAPAAGAALHRRALQRVLGTLVGVPVGVLLLGLGLAPMANAVLGAVAMVLALALPLPRWRSAAFASAAIILLLDNSHASPELAWERVGATVLGALLLVAGAGGVLVLGHLWRRDPTAERVAQQFEMTDTADDLDIDSDGPRTSESGTSRD